MNFHIKLASTNVVMNYVCLFFPCKTVETPDYESEHIYSPPTGEQGSGDEHRHKTTDLFPPNLEGASLYSLTTWSLG